jgi:hypothetical protein
MVDLEPLIHTLDVSSGSTPLLAQGDRPRTTGYLVCESKVNGQKMSVALMSSSVIHT